MNKRRAIAVSVGFHIALLAALGVYFVFQRVPTVEPPKNNYTELPPIQVTPPERKKEEQKPDKIELREPKPVEKQAKVDPIDLPPTPPDQDVAFDPSIRDDVSTGDPEPPSPKATSKPAPDFPEKAKRDGVSGTVEAVITIDEDGRVVNVRIVSATPEGYFEKATIKALEKWRYEKQLVTPASTGPVLRTARVTIDFDLKDQ